MNQSKQHRILSSSEKSYLVQKRTISSNHWLFGSMSGIIVCLIVQPLEIIKINLMLGSHKSRCVISEKVGFARKFLKITSQIYAQEGIRGFWRGIVPDIIRYSLGSAIYFQALMEIEKVQSDRKIVLTKIDNFTNSFIARIISTIALNPIAVIGTRQEVLGFNSYHNLLDGLRKLYQEEGLRGYFRGTLASCFKDGPFQGLFFLVYKDLKKSMCRFKFFQKNKHYQYCSFISGVLSGLVSILFSHPFELIRATLQVNRKINMDKH